MERPRTSTSGGHSGGIVLADGVVVVVVGPVDVDVDADVDEAEVEVELEVSALACFVRLRHAATEVQVRQLRWTCQSLGIGALDQRFGGAYGFPSLPRTTPLGNGVLESLFCDSLELVGVC